MHPALAHWPTRHFYGGAGADRAVAPFHAQRLRNAARAAARWPRPRGVLWGEGPRSVPVLFFDLRYGLERLSAGGGDGAEAAPTSLSNAEEAEALCAAAEALLRHWREEDRGGVERPGVGVMSMYAAQVEALRAGLGTIGAGGLRVDTVDGFQGREEEVILLSTVRSNGEGRVGFLSDWRRLNVALTRARSALLIFGSADTLRHNRHWGRYLQWLDGQGAVVAAEGLGDVRARLRPGGRDLRGPNF